MVWILKKPHMVSRKMARGQWRTVEIMYCQIITVILIMLLFKCRYIWHAVSNVIAVVQASCMGNG